MVQDGLLVRGGEAQVRPRDSIVTVKVLEVNAPAIGEDHHDLPSASLASGSTA